MKRVGLILGLLVVGISAGIGTMLIVSSLTARSTIEVVNEIKSQTTLNEIGGKAVATSGDFEETNPYWMFVKMNLISLDFSQLQKDNPDTVAWLQVAGTTLDLPVTQATNNDYYRSHDFYRRRNKNGWLFLDHRNSHDLTDKNSVVYLKDALSPDFGQILYNGWLSDRANFIVRTATTDGESQNWQIFTLYEASDAADFDSTQTKFTDDQDFGEFLSESTSLSRYTFNVTTSPNDKIITIIDDLDDQKTILSAKLIKKS